MSINFILIIYFFILSSSLFMVFSKNPIYSVFFLILVFINTAILFIFNDVDFLGIILLLVYVGAIAVLFLFMVMMLNIKKIEHDNNFYLSILCFIFFIFIIFYLFLLIKTLILYLPENLESSIIDGVYSFGSYLVVSDEWNNVDLLKKIGMSLFIDNYLLLFFSGVLLLVSLVGSIFLTNFKKGYSMRTQYNQCFRNRNLMNIHIY